MSKSNHFNDENSNTSANPTFDSVLEQRLLNRRSFLGMGASAAAVLGGMSLGLTGCSSGGDVVPGATPAPTATPVPTAAPNQIVTRLGFSAVPKTVADVVTLPPGYKYQVIYALGDPLTADTPAFKNDGTDTDFDKRAGDHHDGMEWFGLDAAGKPSASAADRGLLAMNHEATTDEVSSFFIHANGGTKTLPRPAAEVDKEVDIHGLSVVEIKATNRKWATVQGSSFNRRVTPLTEVEIAGPARGHALLKTKFSPTGTKTRGTINNCGCGKSPWGTYLSGEENWAGYFYRVSADDTNRGDKSVVALKRYGRNAGSTSRHGWETAGADDKYARWNISKTGTSADGSDDYRNEMNGQGYIIEMDAYDKSKALKKRTALGRFAHESAAFGLPVVGKPLTVYLGDDSRNEYMYKFVSKAVWSAADANPSDRIAIGDKYLDEGTLYVAKFNADGSGDWIELSLNNPLIKNYAGYTFADQADICINARLAGDAVGATKMDRPEWGGVHPVTGDYYQTLTNNSNRDINAAASPKLVPDSANPRAYADADGIKSKGNPNGHILRTKEGATVTSFKWDVYLFAAEADMDKGTVNLSNLTDDQDMSSPDGLAFSQSTGICWIQTDDGSYTDVTNCMMLAAIPGKQGDGASKTLSYTKTDGSKLDVVTQVGAAPTADTLKRFLVGPKDCEITGLCETPDGKALFINIQHPGEGTKMADVADPTKYTSQWPSNAGYGAGKRPRSATIVITKDDGGRIGT
ncbi:PhoX family protein [Chitinibacter tainanensis]|uniref:PhoX family protein n=1 Tax=Chitinibacter tainanensis TaxID=230667 RepID=UPI0003F9A9EB|nr:PhoX family phosphatase [Chitinibacter tainanensis]